MDTKIAMITYTDGQFVRIFHTLNEVRILTPDAFEYFSAYLLGMLGYTDVRVSTKHGPFNADGGIDLYANHHNNLVVGQCKHWREGSGRAGYMPFEYVQALGGAMLKEHAQEGVFVSTLPFSKHSKEYAASVNMRLIGPEEINDLIAQAPAGLRHGKWRISNALHRFVKTLGLRQIAKEALEKIAAIASLLIILFLLPYIMPFVQKIAVWIEGIVLQGR